MGVLQRFERRLEGLVGTAFARLFKGQVEPVEVAKALQREAETRRAIVGQDRVLVPNRYVVELGPTDHDRLAPWETQLTNTLAEMVQEHVDDEGWSTFGDIEVALARNEELGTGMFTVSSSVDPNAGPRRRPYNSLSMPAVAAAGPGQGDYGNQGGYPPAGGGYGSPGSPGGYGGGYEQGYGQGYGQGGGYQDEGYGGGYQEEHYGQGDRYGDDRYRADQGGNGYSPPATVPPPAYQQQRLRHLLTVDGSQQWLELHVGSNVIGRGQDADLRLPDTGVSRRHVDIRFDGTGAVLHDLGSTNGTTVNGHRAQSWQLQHGDVVRLGHTVVVYRQEPV
ncbi:MAG TPA: FhaA domain-containing protein [Mycobacteriales bacterium]